MRLFQQTVPAMRLISGAGALGRLAAECDRLGAARVGLICSGSLWRDPAQAGALRAALGGRLAGVFAEVRPHSPLAAVQAAAQALGGMKADAILAVGGGSVIVTARAAGILLAEGRPIGELCTRIEPDGRLVSPRLAAPKLPQILLPTTPTTATAKAGAAVQSDTGARLALYDPGARVRVVLLDPALMAPVPAGAVLSAALNALAMAIEGLLSPRPPSPLADAALIHGLRLIATHLRPALAGAQADRLHLAGAAVLVGQGTDHAGGGVVSALGHAVGPRHHADNGVVNALTLPAALRFNAGHAAEGMAKVATALGLPPDPDPEPLIAALSALLSGLLPPGLAALGVTEADLEPLAAAAMQDWFLRGNPRPATPADLTALLRAAL